MKILITGAGGFIGSYLCQRLSQAHEVIGVARRDYNRGNSMLSARPNFRWHKADLAEGLSLPDDIDIIAHAAARTPGTEATTANYVSDNVVATRNLIDFAVLKRMKLFVYLSAISVYGRINQSIIEEGTPINDPTPYGMTKYIGELLLSEKADVIPSVILRLPVVVGAGMKSGWVFETYQALRQGKPVHIYNGDSPYNMVHISDVYELVLSILRHNHAGNTVFTVSCRDFMSIREITNFMKDYTHSPSEITEEFTGEKGFTISTEKTRRMLGFQPQPASEILTKFLKEMNPNDGG